LRDFNGAIDDCTRAIKLNPFDPYYYSSRGSAYERLDRYKEAIADRDISIKLDSQNPLNYFNRGLARHGAGDFKGAIADLQTAAALYSKSGNKEKYQLTIAKIAELNRNKKNDR
jgi:tetratricopeptide (TPR) repeat protein